MSNNMPGPRKKLTLDALIYQSRWLLFPVNVGLIAAAGVFLARFLWEAGALVIHAPMYVLAKHGDNADLMIAVVKLIDHAMIMALLILTAIGSHQIYVRRFRRPQTNGPQWLRHIDTITMKVKLGLAFVGYSSAKLLEDIITKEFVSREQWIRDVVTHLVFLATTLILALVWRIMHPPHQAENV